MGDRAVSLGKLFAATAPGGRLIRSARKELADLTRFSTLVLRLPLRRYQLDPMRAILTSIFAHDGLEFLVIFPRQAGKNEAVAQLLVYLLNIYTRKGGNIIYGAQGTGLALGIERLEQRLTNPWNRGAWQKRAKPERRRLYRAQVVFLSTHPQATARGHTAHHLLVIDETQDQDQAHIEAVFTSMRASTNAPALYIGTVKLTSDFLWQKKLQLERQQARDGIQRVFMVDPDTVTAQNPYYGDFLRAQVATHGRHHPIVASEYFLEPIDGTGGLFGPRRRALMTGDHDRQRAPQPGALYVATVDVAGEDEAATDPIARLANPARDYTVAHIFQVIYPPADSWAPGPTFRAVDVFVDHGSKHFQDSPGLPALVNRLAAFLQSWQVAHIISDESGVGLGLTSWLAAAFGELHVTGYNFAGPGKKAALGSAFLSVVETGRFRYWLEGDPLGDAWWFFRQVEACTYELPPNGRFDRDLRWSVPTNHKTPTPTGPQLTHDDRLLSAALVAELDRKLATGDLLLGSARSAVLEAADPLAELTF
jgi:hypothetical protein